MFLNAWIEQRDPVNPTKRGVQLVDSTLERYQPGVSVALNQVPNLDNLVVVAQLKDEAFAAATASYYGESESFSMQPGAGGEIPVRVRLLGTPEELIIDFGLNSQPFGVPEKPLAVSQ